MEPEIINRPAFKIVGMKYRGNNESEEIPQLWDAFWPRHQEIAHRVPESVTYGVVDNYDEEKQEFDYVAGFEVDSLTDVPAGMTGIEVPAQTYAVFDCTLPTLMDTIHHVYEGWLPSSGYVRAPGPEFELYDERFDTAQGKLDMSICIPVQKR
jgi:AraC family transcriptional regulator